MLVYVGIETGKRHHCSQLTNRLGLRPYDVSCAVDQLRIATCLLTSLSSNTKLLVPGNEYVSVSLWYVWLPGMLVHPFL